ncbi:hypothetical protein [Microseira sp. BLCC-F43]|uniref:hypothetical protein n=1 Tax=Microseira sp. BLCC-F43 TaxID=3153602 RepID=UPI0035BA413C
MTQASVSYISLPLVGKIFMERLTNGFLAIPVGPWANLTINGFCGKEHEYRVPLTQNPKGRQFQQRKSCQPKPTPREV